MNRWFDRALVASVTVLAAAVTTHYLFEHGTGGASIVLEEGKTLEIGGRKWEGERRTLILVLSTECPGCTQDAFFYQIIVNQARSNGHHITVMMPQDSVRARSWLRKQYIQVDELLGMKPSFLRAAVVPTILVVGDNGIVERIWRGKLSPREQAEVLAFVVGRPNSRFPAYGFPQSSVTDEVSFAQLQEILKNRKVQLLDVRGRTNFARHHLPGAINLPLDELETRGPIELDSSVLTVLDCTEVPTPVCEMAARLLFSAGFREVTMLKDRPSGLLTNPFCGSCAGPEVTSRQ